MPSQRTITSDEFDKIKHYIRDIRVALLTTQISSGALRSRPMATHQLDPDGTMWFFTRADSDKVVHIRQHPSISLSFSDPGEPGYVESKAFRRQAVIDTLNAQSINH